MRGRRNRPETVWERIEIRGPDQCWPWTGAARPAGYGHIALDGHWIGAHRVVFQLSTGVDPGELIIRHTCDNPACCNPAHLVLGTHADNMRDMHERGRWCNRKGTRNPNAKLTEAQAAEIRRRHATGEAKKALAREFGVSPKVIYSLVKGITWRHVTTEVAP